MSSQNVDQYKKIIGIWLEQNILEIVKESESLPVVTADLPNGVGRGNASQIKELKSIDIQGMKLLSINQSHLNTTVEMILEVSVDVYWHEYLASQEVRDFVGETEEEFQSITSYFAAAYKSLNRSRNSQRTAYGDVTFFKRNRRRKILNSI